MDDKKMDSQEFDFRYSNDMCLNDDKKKVKFFEITGQSLVYPMTYHMHEFQKKIIISAIFNNTLVSLPTGLGKNFIAAVATYNFHRWFLNGKIAILSQTKSYLTDQIIAYSSYTTLSDETFTELSANASENDCNTAFKKSIVLTSPQKYLNCLNKEICRVPNLVLLIVFESSKISKCQEYKEIMDKLTGCKLRILVFLESVGFNSKTLHQVVQTFKISKLEIKDIDSLDIKECTFSSDLESVAVEISAHIVSIKDSFYAVFEKYAKKLKDAKVISGNVASLTKGQIQKSKEKFLKDPVQNMSKAVRDDLLESMMMCSFLCYGIELLHNWGVRVFYNYLFDNKKDDELKLLIVKDEHLTNQMKLLNEYLKTNGLKSKLNLSRIIHPKLLYLKNSITRYFSDTEAKIEDIRIIVICSMKDIIDDIDHIFCQLPDFVRYYCIKSEEKCLFNDSEHQEVFKNFLNGVINVLVISNLVDEIFEAKTSLIISLDPNKSLMKLSDPRFNEGPRKCIFVLTKGSEYSKFETMLNEKRNEQKPLHIGVVNETEKENCTLFPQGFDPEFESTTVNQIKRKFKNSPGQKTLLHFLKSSPNISNTDKNYNRKLSEMKRISDVGSPSLFADDFNFSKSIVQNVPDTTEDVDFSYDDYLHQLPAFSPRVSAVRHATTEENDSFDNLILDLPGNIFDTENNNLPHKTTPKKLDPHNPPGEDKTPTKFSQIKKSISNSNIFNTNNCEELVQNKLKKCSISLAELQNESFVDFLFEDDISDAKNILHSEDSSRKPKAVLKEIDCSSNLIPVQNRNLSDFVSPENSQPKNAFYDPKQIGADISSNKSTISAAKNISSERQKVSITLADLENESFCDFLFEDNSPSKKQDSALDSYKSLHKSEFISGENSRDELFKTSTNFSGIQNEKFSNTLFPDSTLQSKKTSNSEVREKVDSDCELFTDTVDNLKAGATEIKNCNSKKRNPRNLTFMSNRNTKQKSKGNESVADSNLSRYSNIRNDCDLFPKSIVAPDCTTMSNSTQDMFDESSGQKKFEYSITDIPDEMLSDFVPDSPSRQKWYSSSVLEKTKISSKSTSPVLFSSRKSNRKHLTIGVDGNQSSSIKFDSFFDISEKNFQLIDNLTSSQCKKPIELKQSTPIRSTNNYEFDSVLFDDDDDMFLDDITKKYENNSEKVNNLTKESAVFGHSSHLGFSKSEHSVNALNNNFETAKENTLIDDSKIFSTSDETGISKTSTPIANQSKYMLDEPRSTKKKMSTINDIFKNKSSASVFFEDTDTVFGSPKSKLTINLPRLSDKTTKTSNFFENGESKKRLFSNFVARMEQKLKVNESVSRNSPLRYDINVKECSKIICTSDDDNDEDNFPWLKNSPIPSTSKQSTPYFKKPQALEKSTPPFNANNGTSKANTAIPEPPAKHKLKKRSKLKRNLVEQFIDAEAEVSDDNEEDMSIDGCSQLSDDSFIDDETNVKPENMTNYLTSLKSPRNINGKFHIPVLSESKLKINVFSQVEDYEPTYEHDSFCVEENDPEPEDAYCPSVLTQMEERLHERKKNKLKPKTKQFKRIRFIEDSSPDSPDVRKNTRKRIKCFSSNSEED